MGKILALSEIIVKHLIPHFLIAKNSLNIQLLVINHILSNPCSTNLHTLAYVHFFKIY